MSNRLETVSKSISSRIAAAKSEQLRDACIAACRLALQSTASDIPVIWESLEQLQQNGKLSQKRIAELNDLAAQLDDRYFDMQEKADGNAELQTEAFRLFRQARAVFALSFASEEDLTIAASESLYEASMAVDNQSEFFSLIENIITK